MKYKNAQQVLPIEVLKVIQEYINGEYLYIPRKQEEQKKWGEYNGSRENLRKRNEEIYSKYVKGFTIATLSKEYFLSDKSIHRIVGEQKRKKS